MDQKWSKVFWLQVTETQLELAWYKQSSLPCMCKLEVWGKWVSVTLGARDLDAALFLFSTSFFASAWFCQISFFHVSGNLAACSSRTLIFHLWYPSGSTWLLSVQLQKYLSKEWVGSTQILLHAQPVPVICWREVGCYYDWQLVADAVPISFQAHPGKPLEDWHWTHL